jgi:2-oxoglutarate dehydrogenase complex dehydrogenase (E1) component-like enzyme
MKLTSLKMANFNEKIFDIFFSYIGRPCAASTATGSKAQHIKELNNLVTEATSL